jgi:hypothetical protein
MKVLFIGGTGVISSACTRLADLGHLIRSAVPADVRRRCGTRLVITEDQVDALVLRPLPADPIGAAVGSLAGPGPTTDEMRAALRRDDTQI